MTASSSAPLIAVGDNCLDVYVDRNEMAIGGNALNVAVQWHREGWNARYFGVVGQDDEADIICEALARIGLSPDDLERGPGRTAITLLRTRDGDRRFLLEDLGVGEGYSPTADRYARMRDARWIHLGTHSSAGLVRRLVADGLPFSIDISTQHTVLPLEGVPLVFASGPDDESVPVEPLLAALLASGACKVVMTCGRRGAFFADGVLRHAAAIEPIEVTDTCGAGDSFIARFVTSFCIEGEPVEAAMAKATRAAAQACQHKGGFPQPLREVPHWLPLKYAAAIGQDEVNQP